MHQLAAGGAGCTTIARKLNEMGHSITSVTVNNWLRRCPPPANGNGMVEASKATEAARQIISGRDMGPATLWLERLDQAIRELLRLAGGTDQVALAAATAASEVSLAAVELVSDVIEVDMTSQRSEPGAQVGVKTARKNRGPKISAKLESR